MKFSKHRNVARILVIVLLLNVFIVEGSFATTVDENTVTHQLLSKERISEGTLLHTYKLHYKGNSTKARIIEVDLRNPYVEIRALSSSEGFNDRKTVNEMAKEQGAVAAINADFFRMDKPAAPFGLHVENGELLSAPAHLGNWLGFGIEATGIAQILNWTFRGNVLFADGYKYELFGYNQPEHFPWSGNSHGNRINLYDRHWGKEVPGVFFDQPMLKVTVQNGIVISWQTDSQPVAIPEDGYVLVADGAGANFLKTHLQIGKKVAVEHGLTPDMNLTSAVGGHALLVEDGKPVNPLKVTMAGRSARSAVGIDATGKTVYFVAIDANPNLLGLTLNELAKFLAELGMDRALNLDGGGSSTMVAQELGSFETKVINQLMYGAQRRLPNAIGIFNNAPVGRPDTLMISGIEGLLLGTEANYSVTGYDSHYHPLVIDSSQLVWEVKDNTTLIKAMVSNGIVKGINPGNVNLRVSYQGISAEKQVRVYGYDDIVKVKIIPEDIRLLPGQNISLAAEVEMFDGRILKAGKNTVKWSTDFGYVENNTYYAGDNTGFGVLQASIDGFIQEIPIRIGGVREPFFTFREWQTLSFRGHPETLQGDFVMETNPNFVYRGNQSGRLEYDFRMANQLDQQIGNDGNQKDTKDDKAEEIKIAYGQLGSGLISMGSNVLGVSAFIHGDNSGHWLRAEIIDATGVRRFVDLADSIDWNGWKRVQGQIDPDWAQPLVLRSIYVVRHPDLIKDNAPLFGNIYIDHVEMIKGLVPEQDVNGNQEDLGNDKNANLIIERHDHDYPAVGMRMLGYGKQINLFHGKPASYRISEPGNPGELVYQLGLWNAFKVRWELLPAARMLDTGELSFTLHQSGIYQLFLTPREKLGFTDIAGHWGKEYLIDLVAAGTLHGYSDRTLRPNQSVTRAEFVVLLHRVFGKALETAMKSEAVADGGNTGTFTDPIPAWAEEAIVFASRIGIVQGYNDGTFRPQQQISRTELAVLMGRTLQLVYPEDFIEMNMGTTEEAVEEVVEEAVGETNEKAVGETIETSVDEINKDNTTFLDINSIPEWALDHVQYMHTIGYLTGHEGYFRPNKPATRAETAVVLWRVIQNNK